MTRYMFLYRGGAPQAGGLSPRRAQEHMARWDDWVAEMSAAGVLDAAEALGGHGTTVGAEGVVVHGPFAESREVVGGFTIVSVDDEDTALRWASACPIFEFGGTVEVRPVVERCLE